MCARLGVGVQFSAPYAQHLLGKAERPRRTIPDNTSAMLHTMYDPNSMWSCTVGTIVILRNRTFCRAVRPIGGVPLTMLTSTTPDASKFRVFTKVPDSYVARWTKRRSAASWSVILMTLQVTVYASMLHAASLHQYMLSFMRRL
jgi:hypothetical protein